MDSSSLCLAHFVIQALYRSLVVQRAVEQTPTASEKQDDKPTLHSLDWEEMTEVLPTNTHNYRGMQNESVQPTQNTEYQEQH